MKAVLYRRVGGPEVLEYTDVPDPEPGPKDVVVDVAVTALNHLDVVQRNGWYAMPGFTLPHIAGMDVAGVVSSIGTEVDGVSVGDRVVVDPSLVDVPVGSKLAGGGGRHGELYVIGATVDGGYAQRCLAPVSHVHRVPADVTLEDAATFPTCFLTAWHALFEVGRLRAGETVLIHAAGSGVSVAAIQLAKLHGAVIIATAGTEEKCRRALELGADHACNNRTADITAFAREVTEGRGVEMVFDHVGPALFEASFYALAIGGRFVTCGNTTGDQLTIPSIGHMYHMGIRLLGSDPYRYGEFAEAWDAFCAAGLTGIIDSEYPLADAAAAQQRMLESAFFGKILLRP
ncbi:MAG TPA: zinc-binding dehydrogenase [Acidimicrobiales bacterium]|jgi:NADPH:quinone reductase-like Zn-dependent oxidoreductase|nr:zinc-binding dehydrogenase [Acidimicrobiales bacterium]